MIRWLEGNPVGVGLAGVCGGLLVISLLLAVVWSLSPSAPELDPDDAETKMELNVPELGESEPLKAYVVITDRPVFNQTRLPVIDEGLSGEDEDDLLAEEEVDAPDVELAGVVITPSIRMATLRTKDEAGSLVAFEGQPLEGNYGSWQVSRIMPREVTLASGDGEEVQLKLQVHDATIKAPPKPQPQPKVAAEAKKPEGLAGDDESAEPVSRAEEIRQRIAERREELKRAAEEKGDTPRKPADYQSAIRQMMSGQNQKKQTDENER